MLQTALPLGPSDRADPFVWCLVSVVRKDAIGRSRQALVEESQCRSMGDPKQGYISSAKENCLSLRNSSW